MFSPLRIYTKCPISGVHISLHFLQVFPQRLTPATGRYIRLESSRVMQVEIHEDKPTGSCPLLHLKT